MNKKNKRRLLALIGSALIVLAVLIAWGNTALMVQNITVASDRLPEAFSGFRIAHVSDLHNAEFGEDNEQLVHLISNAEPDIIVITGDLLDSRHTDAQVALSFAARAAAIAPTYYVTGNHEARAHAVYQELEPKMEAAGVHVLRQEAAQIEQDGQSIVLIGVDDPNFHAEQESETRILQALHARNTHDAYTVLLSHRPELFDVYVRCGVDLVLSGHAHGGQVRLPLIGGLYAPGQGFFPKYDAGLYTQGGTAMVVSRGIGNSIIPLRVNNRPELVVVELSR